MTEKWWILISVACGTFMATLDSSIVNIVLPTLTKSLGAGLDQVKWVVIIYLLVIACLLLPFGRISDQRGRKAVFQLGFTTFILGSFFCGMASRLSWLVCCRGIQAIGAAQLMANGPAIITSTFSAKERGAALGTLAMVVSLGLVTGPSIGGFLIAHLGWRSIFFINIPIGIAGIILVNRFIKKDIPPAVVSPFDWMGAFLQTCLLSLFMFLFDTPQISATSVLGFPLVRALGLFIFLVLGVIFIRVEKKAKAPLFDLTLLQNRTFWTGNLAGFLNFVSLTAVSVLMPFFLEEILHFSPQKAGFFMTAIPLTIFVVAPVSGRLSDRLGSQELSFAGSLIGAIGLFCMAGTFGLGIYQGTDHFLIVLALCTIGLAIGLFQSPNNNAIMGSVPVTQLGVASALVATVRNLGLVTGIGMATAIFTWRMKITGDFVSSFHNTLLISGMISVGAMIASLGKRRGPIEGN